MEETKIIDKTEYDKLLIELAEKDKQIEYLKKQTNIVYDIEKASEIMGIGTELLRKLTKKKLIPSLWIGRGEKVLHSSIIEFFNTYVGYDLRDLDNIKLLNK